MGSLVISPYLCDLYNYTHTHQYNYHLTAIKYISEVITICSFIDYKLHLA